MPFSSRIIPRAINPHAGCGLSHRSIITVVSAPCSGERFHSYSRRDTNRSKERFGDSGTVSRYTGCLRDYGARRDPGPNVIPKRDRIAASTKPRSRHVPHPALAPPPAIYGGSCEFMCAQGDVYVAPASPPTACNRVGPNLENLTDVPVRFDRRSIIVKSAPYLSTPLVGFTRLRVAGACGSSMMIGRSIDRLIVSRIGDGIIRRILALFSLAREIDNEISFLDVNVIQWILF